MIKNPVYIFILFLIFSCKKTEVKTYSKYFDLDKNPKTENYFKSKKKAKIPFTYNQIYDPFLKPKENENNAKLTFEKKHSNTIQLIVLDTVETSINVGFRKKKNKIVKGFPVIIENISEKDTAHFPLFRGTALFIQEAKNTKGEWQEIERIGKEKLGFSYYKIYPKEYIYTKIIKYEGDFETQFRVKMQMNDSVVIYSNEFTGKVRKWFLR